MREIGTILGGMGLLIFAYLMLSNSSGASTVATGLASSSVDVISALQGRSNALG